MKTIITLILLITITMPAISELKDDDLNKIRLLIVESETRIKKEIQSTKDELKSEITAVSIDVASLKSSFEGLDKRVSDTRNLTYALIALIIVAIIPQYIYLFKNGKTEREQDRINQELRAEIEELKQKSNDTEQTLEKVVRLMEDQFQLIKDK